MLFHTPGFFLFFALVLAVYSAVGARRRWFVLLLASLAFYAALLNPYVVGALVVIVSLTYCLGRRIDTCDSERTRGILLWVGIALNVLMLAGMRYRSALSAWWGTVSGAVAGGGATGIGSAAVSAIGVSYVTFQSISYLVDVTFGRRQHEPHFGYLALYLSYFLKLLQGPIERSDVFIQQLEWPGAFDYVRVRSGLILICWGLFKKTAVADRLSVVVDEVFGNLHSYTGLSLCAAVYAYAVQIYADFSGYTDMALGFSRLLGISLTENFDRPYFSASLTEFWRRWHMSFMNWLTDYVFRPVQMALRRRPLAGTVVAVLAVFCISGLWHGAGWTYLLWGALNGALVALGLLVDSACRRLGAFRAIRANRAFKAARTFITFNVVCLCWVFFRASSVGDAVYVFRHLGVGVGSQLGSPAAFWESLTVGLTGSGAYLTASVVVVYLAAETVFGALKMKIDEALVTRFHRIRWPAYFLLVTGILLLWYTETQGFLYFQF